MIDLNDDEQQNVRAALRFLRLRVGAWAPLAKALRYAEGSIPEIANGRKAVTPTLAFRVARFASVAVEDVLDGTYPAPGTCPHCGHPMEDDSEGAASRSVS